MPYPAPLRQSVLDRFFWEADFSLRIAAKGIPRGDIAYMAGCCFRCVACLTQCLFAINGQYWLNEKGAVARAAAFERAPRQYRERTQRSFAALAGDALSQLGALDELRMLSEEVGALR
jgi:hypothetical protein